MTKNQRMRLRSRITTVLGATVILLAFPIAALGHFNDWDSVDNGEIRYEDYTVWDGARVHTITEWNALGRVEILPDSSTTIADLEMRDYTENDGYCGWAGPRAGADLVRFNKPLFNNYSVGQRKACFMHEVGHTLGLEHSYSTQVMDSCPVCTTYYVTPQSHDRQDYYDLW